MSQYEPEPRDVLIVEDEETVRRAARRVLSSEGLATSEAADVRTALAELAGTRFRLVLTDIMLPGESGFALIGWILEHHPRTPVVAITGFATTANALESFRLGAFDFLPKPFDVGELLAVVRRGLRSFETPAQAVPGGPAEGPGPAGGRPRHLLGTHAWARPIEDGSVTFGIGTALSACLGGVERVELPAPDEHVRQGRCWLRIHAPDRLVHRVWAPLSGKVIAVNPDVAEDPALLIADPLERGWAARVLPSDLELELQALTPMAGAGAATVGEHRR